MDDAAFVIDGRYAVFEEFAAGGMASVHYGLRLGEERFSCPVAVKVLHAAFAKDEAFLSAFLDEARMSARVRHPNVVSTIDVVAAEGTFFVVMDYIDGASLSQLLKAAKERELPVPFEIVSALFVGALDGLHAAHEAKDEHGEAMGLVHRDVSPQNMMIGTDGIARMLDFGIAKAEGRSHATREGQLKGKIAYMAPERLKHDATRVSDVYSAGVCLWETLTLRRLFEGDHPSIVIAKVGASLVDPPSTHRDMPPELERIVLKALDRRPSQRWQTAGEMARALESAVTPATAGETSRWVESLLGPDLAKRRARLAEIERTGTTAPVARLSLPAPAPADHLPTASYARTEIDAVPAPMRRLPLVAMLFAIATVAVLAVFLDRFYLHSTMKPAPEPAVAIAPVSATPPETPSTMEPAEPATPPISTELDDPTVVDLPPVSATIHVRHRPPPRPSTTTSLDCDPPYAVDDQGMKHYKKECFRR